MSSGKPGARPALPANRRDASIVLALLLLATSLLAATLFTVWRIRSDSLDHGLVTAVTHVRNFEEHLTQILHLIDVTASTLDPSAGELGNAPALGRKLAVTLRPLPFIRSMSLVDERGRIFASSNPANVGSDIDPGNFYPAEFTDSAILRIGPPWHGRDFAKAVAATEEQPIAARESSFFAVLKRLPVPQNVWLLVTVNPDYFVNHWMQLLDLDKGHVQLLRYDDILLGSSLASDTPGRRGQAGQVGELLRTIEHGEMSQTLPDGRQALTAYRVSSRFPAVLAVHIDQDNILKAWRAEARWIGMIVIPILLALITTAQLLWRRHQRILAQQREIDHERRLAASVFDASSVAMLISNPRGEIVAVNPAFERDTGYRSEELVGLTPRVLKSGLNPPTIYVDMWTTILQGQPWHGELQNRRKDGGIYWESVVISPVLGEEGKITHFVASMENISDKKQHEIELRHAKEAAESANLAKSQFLATISHEIRTPMNGILGMAQLMLIEDTTDNDQRRDYVRTIYTSGQTLLALLNDILDLTKVEAGKMELSNSIVSPRQLIDETTHLFAQSAHEKGLEIEAVWNGAADSRYEADAIRLRQMLSNLISNAIKFTHQGFIRVAASVVEEDAGHALLEFSVTDSGIGISQEHQSKLFQPFSQADSSITRKYGGTGLGLSIIRSLAELMQGTVGVDSEPGQGSRFWFRIRAGIVGGDRERRHAAREPRAGHQAAAETLTDRVLIVEDNAINRKVAAAMLRKQGLESVSVENGQEAVDLIRQGIRPSLILMDMQMPVMDGITATRHIRAMEQDNGLPRLPIVALTANAFAEDNQHCREAGMDDFLVKPLNLDSLKAIIARWTAAIDHQQDAG